MSSETPIPDPPPDSKSKSSSSTGTDPAGGGTGNPKVCKIVIQQCLEARLSFDTDADPPVSIGPGMVVFVCFMQGVTHERLKPIVKAIMNVKLCEPEMPGGGDSIRRKSVLDCNYDILVVPQATLGGKLKGAATQYHGLVSKDLGYELFHGLVKALREFGPSSWSGKVENGVYGARQILKMDNTNGPFTHVFEF